MLADRMRLGPFGDGFLDNTWYYTLATRVWYDLYDAVVYFYWNNSIIASGSPGSFSTDVHGRRYVEITGKRYTSGLTMVEGDGLDDAYYRIARTDAGVVPTTTGH